jgi:hypothetical protein
VGELAAAAREQFGTVPEVVAAALKGAGKTQATVAETKAIVEKFLKRRVN